MKLFIQKILLYLIPVVFVFAIAEYLLRHIPNDYNKKAAVYAKDAEKIRVLILGSSYGLYDLNPAWFDLYTFNGCHALQSLDLDAKIFDKYEKKLNQLQYVIMPVTFASFLFKLEASKENRLIKNYCIYYDLHATNDPDNYLEMLNLPFSVNRSRLSSYYIHHDHEIKVTGLGFDSTYLSDAKDHLLDGPTASYAIQQLNIKDFSMFDEQEKALKKLIEKCLNKNIKVILFTPPAYETFYSISDTAELNTSIRTCQAIQRSYSNVRYINFLEDSTFTRADYFDLSHLNDRGAKKLSLKINKIINADKRSGNP